MNAIKSISLALRVVLDMHALNNEGEAGNRRITRQVGIVTPVQSDIGETSYRRDTVNAISGDMQKHFFADRLRNIALGMGDHVCEACQALDPARMIGNKWFRDAMEDKDNPKFWDSAAKKSERQINGGRVVNSLLTCALDDVCGIMITVGSPIKRKSAVEFGWAIGLPEITQTDEFTHSRLSQSHSRTASPDMSDEAANLAAASDREANLGQMVFSRQSSSGVYAFVAYLDIASIGFNTYTQAYPEEVDGIYIDRAKRMRSAVMALAQTVLHPRGALTSNQLPHVVDIEGFVGISSSYAAAPLVSPLNDNYVYRAKKVSELLNQLHSDGRVDVHSVTGAEGLLGRIVDVLDDATPGTYIRYKS